MPKLHRNTLIALAGLAFALLTLLVWIPLDIESGVLEKHRRTLYIGDAMLPTLCAVLILMVSALLLLGRFLSKSTQQAGNQEPNHSLLLFQLKTVAIIGIALALMFYLGQISVWLANSVGFDMGSYRELRDTVPWKYLGFSIGGSLMVAALISLIEQRWRWCNIAIGLLTCLILIAMFDLPFEDLLLPPNGDY